MLKLLTCVHGHFWESSPPSDNGELPAASKHCPTCGAPADELPLLDLAESERADLETVVPPPAPKATDLFDNKGFPILPGYEVLESLGKNRKGVLLFRAKQILINRPVLLKVVIARADVGQQSWGALRGEANTLAKFDHPNIPRIHEVGERDRQLFYNVVDWFDGAPLSERLTDKPFPPKAAAHFVENVARALHVVHERGVVHRNLKPSSLLLEAAEKKTLDQCAFKIDDLGIAGRAVEGEVNDLELQGKLPFYLAPEQVLGYAKDIGPETDVYALGVLLYELLSGRPPYRGERVSDVLERIRSRAAPPPIETRRVPRDLKAICAKCLQKSPRRRYASALDLAEDLRRYREGVPVMAHDQSPHFGLIRWLWRRPAHACILLLVILLCVSTFAAFVFGLFLEENKLIESQYKVGVANHEADIARIERDQARRNEQALSYAADILAAQAALSDNRTKEAQRLLNGCPRELRQWEWLYLTSQANKQPPWTFTPPVKNIVCVLFSPDGRYLAVAGENADAKGKGIVLLRDLQWGQNRALAPFLRGAIRDIAFRHDSQSLAVVSDNKLQDRGSLDVFNVLTGDCKLSEPIERAVRVQYSLDDNLLAIGCEAGQLWLLQAATAAPLQVAFLNDPFGINHKVTNLAFSTDGRRLLVSRDTLKIDVFTLSNWQAVSEINNLTNNITTLAAGQNGQIVAGDTNKKVHIWNAQLQEQNVLTFRGTVERVFLTSDGKRLAVLEQDGRPILHWYDGQTLRELLTVKDLPQPLQSITLDHAGRRLAVATAKTVTIYGENDD